MRRHILIVLSLLVILALASLAGVFLFSSRELPRSSNSIARLSSVGPRVLSNRSDYPVVIYGENVVSGSRLVLSGGGVHRVIETHFLDARHLTARVPFGIEIPPDQPIAKLKATLLGPDDVQAEGSATVTLINDLTFPTPYALARIGDKDSLRLVIASPSSRELAIFHGRPEAPARISTGDRPRAFAVYRDRAGVEQLAIAFEGRLLTIARTPEIERIALGEDPGVRTIALSHDAQDVAVDGARGIAYLTSHEKDAVIAVDLDKEEVVRTISVGVNPRAIALAETQKTLFVANIGSEDVSMIDLASGTERRIRPKPGTPILGGHTEPFSARIMGGKAGRALVVSERLHVAFMSTVGPNIGPNPERMEVSMNGGVSVIDTRTGEYLRHLSIVRGVPEGLALDESRGLLYAADGATGRVVVLSADRLAKSDEDARKSILGSLDLPVPEGTPWIRPKEDFAVQGRASASLHFGPRAIQLSADGGSLFVLSRFSGSVVEIDLSKAREGKLEIRRAWPSWTLGAQTVRRKGEIIYDTDLGNSRMTCDTCHPEGHNGGLLFTKGHPMRIYRSPTIRAIRESPPYFTPSRLPSIKAMSTEVLARNRFQNPIPTDEEIAALTMYVGTIAGLPNPNVGDGGELPRALVLPDGKTGDAVAGLGIFEGKGGCSEANCHPAPHFTADQTLATRGRLERLGTGDPIPLHAELQDHEKDFGQPSPSLVGIWDNFPLLWTGAAGHDVEADHTIAAKHPFALRHVLENPAWSRHANGAGLSEKGMNDLLAYLLTL